jgi:hypothetical protein
MPITVGAGDGGVSRRRTTRSSVSLLTGSISRRAAGCGPTSKRETEVMNQCFQSARAPCPGSNNPISKAFREDPLPAPYSVAPETADIRHQFYGAARQWQIRDLTPVTAVNAAADAAALWAMAGRRRATNENRCTIVGY